MHTAAFLAFLGTAGVLPSPPPTTLSLVEPEEVESSEAEPERTEEFAAAMRTRGDLRIPHIIAGNATFGSMTGTFLLGWLHFNDEYGWTGDPSDTGCARGDTIMGTDFCTDPPWPHLIGSIVATTAMTAALTLSFLMPDPGLEYEGERATWLDVHRVMRWGMLGLLVAQMALGIVTANVDTGNFGDQRALAITHLAVGTVAYAALIPLAVTGWLLAWG